MKLKKRYIYILHCSQSFSIPYKAFIFSIGISRNISRANIVKVTFPDISCTFSLSVAEMILFPIFPNPTMCYFAAAISLNFLKGWFLLSWLEGKTNTWGSIFPALTWRRQLQFQLANDSTFSRKFFKQIDFLIGSGCFRSQIYFHLAILTPKLSKIFLNIQLQQFGSHQCKLSIDFHSNKRLSGQLAPSNGLLMLFKCISIYFQYTSTGIGMSAWWGVCGPESTRAFSKYKIQM